MSLRKGLFRRYVENIKNKIKDPSEFNPPDDNNGETSLASRRGSITAEAALAVPLFLMFFASFLGLFKIMHTQIEKQYEIDAAIQKAAVFSGIFSDDEKPVFEPGLSPGGYGIKIEDDEISVSVPFYEKTLFSLPFSSGVGFGESVCRRVWSGRVVTEGEAENTDEIYVFVAENGTVYHRSEGCTHLRLSISPVSSSDVGEARNENGGKYYPCEKCGGNGETVFIAKEGNRYHSSMDCSGLKRSYERVLLSETDLPACSRCGK